MVQASLWSARGCKESVGVADAVSSLKIVVTLSDGLGFPVAARAGHRLPLEKEPERKRFYTSAVR